MGGDRSAVEAIDPRQLTGPSTSLIAGQQRLDLDRGRTSLDAAQFADVRTPRSRRIGPA
jgi:hypothetical protein